MISGLMKTMSLLGSSSAAMSIRKMRWFSPICVAASPTPGAAYMVSAMSSISFSMAGVTRSTGSAFSRSRGSG
jgi:hypothetical protein